MNDHTDLIIASEVPLYGWSQDTLLEQLDAYHAVMHGEEGQTAWYSTINGSYTSACGLRVDMLQALRVAGAMRN